MPADDELEPRVPRLELTAWNANSSARAGPQTPESPLWSPPSDLIYQTQPVVWSDSDDEFEYQPDFSYHQPLTETDGVPVPRTGVRRALLQAKHKGDRSFSAVDAPPHDNHGLPIESVSQ